MPTYEYRCPTGHQQTIYLPLSLHEAVMRCHCGLAAEQVISAPLLVAATPDVCYDSPIDGRPITSMAARREDLARSGCRPYDPGMRQDADRRRHEGDVALEQAVERTVEESVERMPTPKRGRLYSELTEQGLEAQYMRSTKED